MQLTQDKLQQVVGYQKNPPPSSKELRIFFNVFKGNTIDALNCNCNVLLTKCGL